VVLGFSSKLGDDAVGDLHLAVARGRVDAGDGADAAVRAVEVDERADVDAAEAVAVGEDERVGVDVRRTRWMRPPVPVLRPVSASVTSQSSSPLVWKVGGPGVAEADGEVGDLLAVAEEVLLDQPALEAEAEHEVPAPVVGEQLHDVPHDRALADADQRLGDALGLLAHAGAVAAGEDHHRHPVERGVAAAHAGTRRRSASSSSPASTSCLQAGEALEARGEEVVERELVRRVRGEDLVDPLCTVQRGVNRRRDLAKSTR
jgi:hypothetical protein